MMKNTPIIISEAGAYSDFDNTGIVIINDDRRVAVFHRAEDAEYWTACVNALEGFSIAAIEGGAVKQLVEVLTEISVHADVRLKDCSKTFARVNRGALRSIRDKADAALALIAPAQAKQEQQP
jgi:hypothetical protein